MRALMTAETMFAKEQKSDLPEQKVSFVITLVAIGGWPGPPIVRLRRLLKCAYRSFGFRCLSVEETTTLLPLPSKQA
jgi:hypothetical protein